MFSIKVDGHFIHSVVPDEPVGLGIRIARSDSSLFIKFAYREDAEFFVSLLQEHFPYDEFEIVRI